MATEKVFYHKGPNGHNEMNFCNECFSLVTFVPVVVNCFYLLGLYGPAIAMASRSGSKNLRTAVSTCSGVTARTISA